MFLSVMLEESPEEEACPSEEAMDREREAKATCIDELARGVEGDYEDVELFDESRSGTVTKGSPNRDARGQC